MIYLNFIVLLKDKVDKDNPSQKSTNQNISIDSLNNVSLIYMCNFEIYFGKFSPT